MDLLAEVACNHQQSFVCLESTIRPTSPLPSTSKPYTEFKTPERKNIPAARKLHVFSTTSQILCKVDFEDEVKLSCANIQYITTTKKEMVVKKRFTCLKGPIEKGQKCVICNVRTKKKTNKQCQSPYHIFYSNDLKEPYDTVPLTKSVTEAYKSFSPSIISKITP
jgi:hypothetical protein